MSVSASKPRPTLQREPTPPADDAVAAKYASEQAARLHVSVWADRAAEFAPTHDDAGFAANFRSNYRTFGLVTAENLFVQITVGTTDLAVDEPDNSSFVKFLAALTAPPGYTLTIVPRQQDPELEAAEVPGAQTLPHPPVGSPLGLDPHSPHRAFSPAGGMVKMPLRPLSEGQRLALQPLAEQFFKEVKDNHDQQRCAILVGAFLRRVENQAEAQGADVESFQFEVGAQVADLARRFANNKPLADLAPRLPETWRHLFDADSESKSPPQDSRPLLGSVARGRVPGGAQRVNTTPAARPQVPTPLVQSINRFVAFYKESEPGQRVADAKAIVRQIRGPTGDALAMTDAVGSHLRLACDRANNPEPLLCFASNLKGDAQALFLDVLMADQKFTNARSLVAKIGKPLVMDEKQFATFQLKLVGMIKIIDKLPYQTKMMIVNDYNQQLERVANANAALAVQIRGNKIDITDLEA